MAELLVRPTQLADAPLLADFMRDSDVRELHACGRTDMLDTVERSIKVSMVCWSFFIDGELAAIMGVAPLSVMGGVGVPWMLGTKVLERHSRILVRTAPRYIGTMLDAFPHLVNYVHTKNTSSVRWLKRLGFTFSDPAPYGPLGEPFCRFEMRG